MEAEEAPPDSLEGWVAVRASAFSRPERAPQLRFLVAWNAVESKFALTCHNRTRAEEEEEEEGEGGGEKQRPAGAPGPQQQLSWAGLYSPQALEGIHRQLAALSPRLEAAFPALPPALSGQRVGGLWALLFPGCPVLAEAELEGLCRRLEGYLGWALELCGHRALLDSLFGHDQDSEDEYFENLREFRRKALKAQLDRAKDALRRILHQHKDADSLVTLLELYKEEEDAYWELVTVATEFYQYLLQPFRDVRELATLYRLEIMKSLQGNRLGPRRTEVLQKEADEWTNEAEEAVCSIQDIMVGYFKETAMALTAMHKQMEQDQKRFGQASWALASPRMEKLKYLLAKETLQHMRAKELCLKHKRTNIRKQMETLGDHDGSTSPVEELEIEYYETQLELFEVQFEILKNEELLLVAQLETLRRQVKETQDEVVYYDTCESPDELDASEGVPEETCAPSPEMVQLRQKIQQLETKRGIICSRRAYLRNKKDQCEESRRLQVQQAQESIQYFQQHHSIQIKRDKRKEEEKKKKAWIKQERQKTVERLKTFKEKCPAQIVLKTSRPQPLNSKQQKGTSHRTVSASSEALSKNKIPTAKQMRPSRLGQAKDVKASHQKFSKDVPVQIFTSPCGLEQHKREEVDSALMPPPPPPPPPPLPPPPPPLRPSTQDVSLRTQAEDEDKPSPLMHETLPRKHRDSMSRCTADSCTGTMDEVLASLKRGEILLRKVKPTAPPVSAGTSLNDSILAAIKQGVKLRKVSQEPKVETEKGPNNELERSIKAAIQRIKKVSADSEEDENSDYNSGEWNC